jgi:hypothetical protein
MNKTTTIVVSGAAGIAIGYAGKKAWDYRQKKMAVAYKMATLTQSTPDNYVLHPGVTSDEISTFGVMVYLGKGGSPDPAKLLVAGGEMSATTYADAVLLLGPNPTMGALRAFIKNTSEKVGAGVLAATPLTPTTKTLG